MQTPPLVTFNARQAGGLELIAQPKRLAYELVGRAAERSMLWLLITYLACLAVILNDVARALDEPRWAD